MATEQEELEILKKNSPYALPDDAARSGWTTGQIKEKFYAGLLVLYEWFKTLRNDVGSEVGTLTEELEEAIETFNKILTGETPVAKAIRDGNGDEISVYYAKISKILDGTIAALKYTKSNGTDTENISAIEPRLMALITVLQGYFTNGSAKTALVANKASQDGNGDNIVSKYATKASLANTDAEVTKIKNGSTTVDRAYKDQDGNSIKNTYVKHSQVVNNLTSTSTSDPLSANQGKELKAMITAIQQILESPDTDLDTLREIVAYIKEHQDLIEAITTEKMSFTDLVTNYSSNLNNKPLAANVAVLLKGLIDSLEDVVDTKANSDDVYTKEETYSQEEVDTKMFGSALMQVEEYDPSTGLITFIYNSGAVTPSYNSSTGILTITY